MKVYLSFNYAYDLARIKRFPATRKFFGSTIAGLQDDSKFKAARQKGDDEVKRLIDQALKNTLVTVFFIGNKDRASYYLDYELEKSIERGNGLVGIAINQFKDALGETGLMGTIPPQIREMGFKVYKFLDIEKLALRINEANEIAYSVYKNRNVRKQKIGDTH